MELTIDEVYCRVCEKRVAKKRKNSRTVSDCERRTDEEEVWN